VPNSIGALALVMAFSTGAAASSAPRPSATPRLLSPAQRAQIAYRAVLASSQAFRKVHSFAANFTSPAGTVLVEYKAPDRFRLSTLTRLAILVGDTAYVKEDSGWTSGPVEDDEFAAFAKRFSMEPVIMAQWAKLTVVADIGHVAVEHHQTEAYQYTNAGRPGEVATTTVWIDTKTLLPVALRFDTADHEHIVVQYNSYNTPIKIDAPGNSR